MAKKRTHNRNFVSKEIDQEVFDDILFRMMNGEAVTKICKEETQPHYSVFMNWVRSDQDLFDHYARARTIQTDYFFDEMVEIADDEKIDINRAKVKIDARQWHVGKISPKKYGTKIMNQIDATVTHSVKPDLSRLSSDAREELRTLLIEQMRAAPKTISSYAVEIDE